MKTIHFQIPDGRAAIGESVGVGATHWAATPTSPL